LRGDIDAKLLEIFDEKLKQHYPQLKYLEDRSGGKKEYIEAEKKKLFKKIGVDLDQAEQDLIAYTEGRKQKDFFLWDVYFAEVFAEKGGFDIVIGNPPYINISNLQPDEYRLKLRSKFRSAKNKTDMYAFFIENSFNLINKFSFLSFIIPQTWKATDSFLKLREIIFKEKSLIKVIDLDYGTFDATVKPMVVIFSNQRNTKYSIDIYNDKFEKIMVIGIDEVLSDKSLSFNTSSSSVQKNLFLKIEKDSIQLNKLIQFSRGIKTSNDIRFVLREKKNKDCRPVFRGKNVERYNLKWAGEYIWYRPDLMKEKVGCVTYTKEFFEVPEKIITQRISIGICSAYDSKNNYFLDTTIVSNYSTWDGKTNMKFIVSILNSSLINFWFKNKHPLPTVGIYELHSIPMKITQNQSQFTKLVDKILSSKKQNPEADTQHLEDQIDIMVYKLYNLTYEEVKIIDPEIEKIISREEYEKFEIQK